MAYPKIVFQNSPSTATPLNAENLNHMDDQIALNDQRLTEIETSYVKSFNGRKGEVVPESGDYNIGQIAPLTGAQVGQVPVVVNVGTEEDPELEFQMGAGGGGGHVIQNASGTDMPQESAMQFADSHVSDDSINGRTVVENIKEVLPADYDSTTDEGIIVCDDGNDVPIGEIEEDVVSVTASSDTYRSLINKLRDEIDFSKLTQEAYIMLGTNKYVLMHFENGEYQFTNAIAYSTSALATIFLLENTNGQYRDCSLAQNSGAVNTDKSTSSIANGTVITLYYGTSSTVINLLTDARHCIMSDGVTSVESAINLISYKRAGFSGTTSSEGLLALTGFEYLDGYRILYIESCTLENVTYTIAHGTTPNFIVFNSIGGQSVANQNVVVVFYYTRV